MTWIMTPGGKAWVQGQGAVKAAEGKHSSCFQAKKDPSACAQSEKERERERQPTRDACWASSKATPWHWFPPRLFMTL